MATEGGLLGVVRAARPHLRSSADVAAFAVHAAFLSAGYSLTATGPRASSDLPVADGENVEVGIDGWNEMDGAYAFHYSGAGQSDLCKSVIVKCIAVGDMLMVDAMPADKNEDQEPLHLGLRVNDYVTGAQGTNYGQLYKNLNEFADKVNSLLLSKLSAPKEAPSSSRKEREYEDYVVEGRTGRMGMVIEEPPPAMPGFLPVPTIGGSDLLPGPGAGVFPGRVDPMGGGMLLGPNDPRWGIDRGYGISGFPQDGRGMVPPGARFDPFGPPGIPGFEPDRFTGVRRPPPGGSHPDLEHFKPF